MATTEPPHLAMYHNPSELAFRPWFKAHHFHRVRNNQGISFPTILIASLEALLEGA